MNGCGCVQYNLWKNHECVLEGHEIQSQNFTDSSLEGQIMTSETGTAVFKADHQDKQLMFSHYYDRDHKKFS